MSRYIDADELKKLIEEEFKGVCVYDVSPDEAVSDFCDVVDNCSSADVAPVVHGHWKNVKRVLNSKWGECSNCDRANDITHYCPYCGAEMSESEDSGNV